MYVCMHICMCVCMYVRVHIHMCMCVYVCACAYVCMCECVMLLLKVWPLVSRCAPVDIPTCMSLWVIQTESASSLFKKEKELGARAVAQ